MAEVITDIERQALVRAQNQWPGLAREVRRVTGKRATSAASEGRALFDVLAHRSSTEENDVVIGTVTLPKGNA